MSAAVVAIVGRPNVGKSTLFNRILGRTHAVVDDQPGITRDRHYAIVEWAGRRFHLVDTGGWVPEGKAMDGRILHQILKAIEECDLVLFLVDARDGLQPHDEEIARELKKTGLPVLLAANKVDSEGREGDAAEFSRLGIGQIVHSISAIQGRNIGDFLDDVVSMIPDRPEPKSTPGVRIAVLGRPNVGKSSIVNRLLGEDRMIVDDVPGTTRDAVDVPFRYHGQTLILVDTAGIRRKLSAHPDFEFYATLRSIRSLESADVALFVIDAHEPLSKQDIRIARMIDDAGKPCVWVFNKWDLVEKTTNTAAEMLQRAREEIPFQAHAPAEFVSALTVQRVSRLPERILEAVEASRRKVSTADLNECLRQAVEHNPPKHVAGQKPVRLYYATQVRIAPPTFAIFVSQPQRLSRDYERYLLRSLRERFGFEGSPIRLQVRKST